jgi:hypothetical protein
MFDKQQSTRPLALGAQRAALRDLLQAVIGTNVGQAWRRDLVRVASLDADDDA